MKEKCELYTTEQPKPFRSNSATINNSQSIDLFNPVKPESSLNAVEASQIHFNLAQEAYFLQKSAYTSAKTREKELQIEKKHSKDLYPHLFNKAARICVAATMICITLAISYRAVGLANQLCEQIQDELTQEACRIASVGLGCLLSGIGFFSIGKVMHCLDEKLFNHHPKNQTPVVVA